MQTNIIFAARCALAAATAAGAVTVNTTVFFLPNALPSIKEHVMA